VPRVPIVQFAFDVAQQALIFVDGKQDGLDHGARSRSRASSGRSTRRRLRKERNSNGTSSTSGIVSAVSRGQCEMHGKWIVQVRDLAHGRRFGDEGMIGISTAANSRYGV
jgi:hypothetical protein